MISVALLSDWPQIHALRDRWECLYSLTQEVSYTQSLDWYQAACSVRKSDPVVAVAVVAGKIIGLWPMFLVRTRPHLRLHRTLTSGGLEAPLLGPVGPHPTATAALVARHLSTAGEWDSALFTAAPRNRFNVAYYSAAFRSAGITIDEEPAQPIGVVNLSGRWTDLVSQCTERVRLAVYRQRHRSSKENFSFDRIRPAASSKTMPALVDEVLDLCAPSRNERQFLKSTIETACHSGAADIAVMRREGRILATSLGFVTSSNLENFAIRFARGVDNGVQIHFLDMLLSDSQLRGDRLMTFVAGPGHPANDWSSERRRRVAIRCHAPGHSFLRYHDAGARFLHSLRFRRSPSPA